MQLSPVVAHLRDWCPSFQRRISGGIDWDSIEASVKLQQLRAHVVLGDEDAEPNEGNVVCQNVAETFEVCVEFPSTDERGAGVGDLVDAVRIELCRALVGWPPAGHYDPITYLGRELLLINRVKAVYRFQFLTGYQLGRNSVEQPPETWQELEADGLPDLEGIDISVDFIDPMVDKNLSPTGPDGRIEINVREDL
jgi:hypothetical protein